LVAEDLYSFIGKHFVLRFILQWFSLFIGVHCGC